MQDTGKASSCNGGLGKKTHTVLQVFAERSEGEYRIGNTELVDSLVVGFGIYSLFAG